jgi:hypothetical protein
VQAAPSEGDLGSCQTRLEYPKLYQLCPSDVPQPGCPAAEPIYAGGGGRWTWGLSSHDPSTIETPEGKIAGLVNFLTVFAQGTQQAFPKHPIIESNQARTINFVHYATLFEASSNFLLIKAENYWQ